jgi:hypothetical protein
MLDPKKLLVFAKHLAKRFPEYRQFVLKIGARVAGWLSAFAILSAGVSLSVNGTEFFTKKIPQAVAFVSKKLLLGGTLRPTLIRRVVDQDLAYSDMCIGPSQTLDLDNDGDSSDLFLELYPKQTDGACQISGSTDSIYVILKLEGWKGIWPTYTLLRALARTAEGDWGLSIDYSMVFESRGPFLVGSITGTDFTGYSVFGYANGVLHLFGNFRPFGSSREIQTEDALPIMQIGNRMFLNTEDAIISLEVTSQGQFVQEQMASLDIVKRHNSALVIELFENMPETPTLTDTGAQVQSYARPGKLDPQCGRHLFANGGFIELKPARTPHVTCEGALSVFPTTVIVSRTPCDFEGFRRTNQFPWGYIYDPEKSSHVMNCPADGDHDGYHYRLMVSLR